MEMTIDTAKEWLISRKEHYEMDDNCQELAQALDIALEIMRKYQKIEEILNWRDYDVDPNYHTNEDMINEIREVLEDGNNNQHN